MIKNAAVIKTVVVTPASHHDGKYISLCIQYYDYEFYKLFS